MATKVSAHGAAAGPHGEIALARGKDLVDKRQTIKERELKREMERSVRR